MCIDYDFLSTIIETKILNRTNAILGIGTELSRPVVYYVFDESLPEVEYTIAPISNNEKCAIPPNAQYLGAWKNEEKGAQTVHYVAFKDYCDWAKPIHGGNE